MRARLTLLPITALLFASTASLAQDAPRVLFCSGGCFAVDAEGVRTPAPKGTQLAPGQRLETGPNAYAQLRLGRDAALGVGEQARVRFDGNAVTLDQGRLRMIGGDALGRPDARPVELRTGDGAFVLRSADVEVRKAAGPQTAGIPTFMKVNAGDASLRSAQGEIAIPRDGVQGITAGRVMTGPAIAVTEVAPASRPTLTTAPAAAAPVAAPVVLTTAFTPVARQPIVLAPTLAPTVMVQPATTVVVAPGDVLLRQPVVDSSTGATTTLTKVITQQAPVSPTPTLTTQSKTLTLQPATTISPALTTQRILLR